MNATTYRNVRLAHALRLTAQRLDDASSRYQWAHQGHCNCGHLAQTLTGRSAADIHALALEKAGDWSQHAYDYCPSSGYPIDHVISTMLDAGLTTDDLEHLERLSDPRVLRSLPRGRRALNFRHRDDVVVYLRAWADLLEAA